MQDVAADVGQSEVTAGVAIRQLGMVHSEKMQDGGMEIIDVDRIADDVPADFIGLADDATAAVAEVQWTRLRHARGGNRSGRQARAGSHR